MTAKTPDGRWTNWAITRIMKLDDRHMTGLVLPSQHVGMIWREWEAAVLEQLRAEYLGGEVADLGVPCEHGDGKRRAQRDGRKPVRSECLRLVDVLWK